MNEVMDEIMQRSHELREDPNIHYNCAQGVFIPFAERKGLTAEQAGAITENLGLYGIGGARDTVEFIQRIGAQHEGRTQCRDLLSAEVKSPLEKKPHCDNMVYEAVLAVEEMLEEHGIEI